MKIFRTSSLFIAFLAFLLQANSASACTPGEKKTTSMGATFTCLKEIKGWGEAWLDPSGAAWSSYIGEFSNIGPNQENEIIDSPATRACQSIGARLPSLQDFTRLQHYFELNSNGTLLSPQGLKDLHAIFPDMEGSRYWSTTLWPYNIQHAYFFSGSTGWIDFDGNEGARYVYNAVRCTSL